MTAVIEEISLADFEFATACSFIFDPVAEVFDNIGGGCQENAKFIGIYPCCGEVVYMCPDHVAVLIQCVRSWGEVECDCGDTRSSQEYLDGIHSL